MVISKSAFTMTFEPWFWIKNSTACWYLLLCDRPLCVQVPAPLRYESPTTFDRTGLGHDLRPNLCWLGVLPGHHRRPADSKRRHPAQLAPSTLDHRHYLDVVCVQQYLQASVALHRFAECAKSGAGILSRRAGQRSPLCQSEPRSQPMGRCG